MFGITSRIRGRTSVITEPSQPEIDELALSCNSTADSTSLTLVPSDSDSKFRCTGFNLLQIALTESQGNNSQDQAFSRQVHIDALSYLLRGLPNDLTEQEASQIRNASRQKERVWMTPSELQPRANPSLLHRGLASIIILACVLIRLILPYVKHFFVNAYRFERSHQVSERALAFGMSSVDLLGKRSIVLVKNALGHEVVANSMAYCIEGVRGGLTEGLEEGLKCIEAAQAP